MKRYYKKSEILREMWKDTKDVRLLARMIARWEIIEEWGKWRFADDDSVTVDTVVDKKLTWEVDKKLTLLEQELEKEKQKNINLLKENEELKKKCSTNTTPSLSDNDLLDHLALMYTYVEIKNEFIKWVVQSYFNKYQWQYDWDWAVEKVYQMYQYNPDEWEQDELEYVKSLVG